MLPLQDRPVTQLEQESQEFFIDRQARILFPNSWLQLLS